MIRLSTPADSGRLFEIWRSAVLATHHFLTPEHFDEIAAIVERDYLPAADFWVLAEKAGVIAFIGMTGPHIDALFVDPAHHGKGAGRALVAKAFDLYGTLTVDVNEQNPGAVGFYERLSFVRERRSETDDAGRPYPILHLRRG